MNNTNNIISLNQTDAFSLLQHTTHPIPHPENPSKKQIYEPKSEQTYDFNPKI